MWPKSIFSHCKRVQSWKSIFHDPTLTVFEAMDHRRKVLFNHVLYSPSLFTLIKEVSYRSKCMSDNSWNTVLHEFQSQRYKTFIVNLPKFWAKIICKLTEHMHCSITNFRMLVFSSHKGHLHEDSYFWYFSLSNSNLRSYHQSGKLIPPVVIFLHILHVQRLEIVQNVIKVNGLAELITAWAYWTH